MVGHRLTRVDTTLAASHPTFGSQQLDVVDPLHLYFNLKQIISGRQVWRLVTNFLYFGDFSIDFVFHMFFLVRYCRMLEEGSFRGRTSDFFFMLLLGATFMTVRALTNYALPPPPPNLNLNLNPVLSSLAHDT